MQISGNILCIVVEGRKKISTDFLWGLVLIAFIGITVNFLKMKANAKEGLMVKRITNKIPKPLAYAIVLFLIVVLTFGNRIFWL